MKRLLALAFLLSASTASAQNYGAFVAKEADGSLVASYVLTNAPTLTNSCADYMQDGAVIAAYRAVVSQSDYSSGWAALPQATKNAAKAAGASERSDLDAKLDKLTRAFALVVLDELNTIRANVTSATNLPARTAAQLKAAVAAKYPTLP